MKKNISLNTVLIIGNHIRHKAFAYFVEKDKNINIKSYIVFKRENPNPLPPKNIDPELKKIWVNHFKIRNLTEKKFFGEKDLKKNLPKLEIKKGDNLNSKKTINFIKKQKLDLAIIYGSDIIKDPLFSFLPKYKLNFHLGLIPHFKGSITMIWPFLLLQPNNACCTFHLIDKPVDTGEIIHQISPVLNKGDRMHETISKTCLKSFYEFKYVAKELKKRILNKVKIKYDKKLKQTGKIFTKSDFQAEHLRIIYIYYKDMIVDLYLKKKVRPKKIKLVQLKK